MCESTSLKWVLSFMLRPLYPRGKASRCLGESESVWLQRRKQKTSWTYRKSNFYSTIGPSELGCVPKQKSPSWTEDKEYSSEVWVPVRNVWGSYLVQETVSSDWGLSWIPQIRWCDARSASISVPDASFNILTIPRRIYWARRAPLNIDKYIHEILFVLVC